jgi:hypothetical protein
MRSARSGRLFGLTCLLVLLPLAGLGAGNQNQKPAEQVDKPKEVKPGEGAKDDKAKGENKPGKDDKPKEGDKPGKDDKPKEEEKPGPPTLERYVELLRSENVLVRKRSAIYLIRKKDPDAFPALLEMSKQDPDRELRKFVQEELIVKKLFSTSEMIGALLKVVKDSSGDAARRQIACDALSGQVVLNEKAATYRSEVEEALELALADANRDVQAAAAQALDDIDHPDRWLARAKRVGGVRVALDAAAMRALRLKPEDVLDAIREQFPEFKARLANENTITASLKEEDRLVLERLKLPGKAGARLKDVLAKERPAAATDK